MFARRCGPEAGSSGVLGSAGVEEVVGCWRRPSWGGACGAGMLLGSRTATSRGVVAGAGPSPCGAGRSGLRAGSGRLCVRWWFENWIVDASKMATFVLLLAVDFEEHILFVCSSIVL